MHRTTLNLFMPNKRQCANMAYQLFIFVVTAHFCAENNFLMYIHLLIRLKIVLFFYIEIESLKLKPLNFSLNSYITFKIVKR